MMMETVQSVSAEDKGNFAFEVHSEAIGRNFPLHSYGHEAPACCFSAFDRWGRCLAAGDNLLMPRANSEMGAFFLSRCCMVRVTEYLGPAEDGAPFMYNILSIGEVHNVCGTTRVIPRQRKPVAMVPLLSGRFVSVLSHTRIQLSLGGRSGQKCFRPLCTTYLLSLSVLFLYVFTGILL